MPENESGIVSTPQALQLLLLETTAELRKIERAGWIKPAGKDRWPLIALVQGVLRYWQWRAATATTAELSAIWGISKQFVAELSDKGFFKVLDGYRGVYKAAEAHSGYVRYLKQGRAAISPGESKVRDARLLEIEMRMAIKSGDLMKRSEHVEILDEVVGLFRAELSGLPARVSRDLQERGRIEQAINDILDRIAARATESADAVAAAPGAGGQAVAPDLARQVGG